MQAVGRRVAQWSVTAVVAGALVVAGFVLGPATSDTSTDDLAAVDQLVGPGQPTSGDGWRLLAAVRGVGPVDDADVAADAAAYRALWEDTLGLRPARPDVDFDAEVVVWFGAVHSGTCPDIRLDDVVVDVERQPAVVHPRITVVDPTSFCTADANPFAFVVAVTRSMLPPGAWIAWPDEEPPRDGEAPSPPPPADAGRRG